MTRHLVFQGADSVLVLCCHLGAIGLTLLLIVLLLRYERQLVSATIGNWLLVLRISVLAVVLMTLLQPVLSWTLDQKRTGRILVGIDLSDSMGTTDVHAMRAEKLRWARGLGMIGNPSIDARLDRWQQAFEEHREPEWVDPDESTDDDRRAALEQSRRNQLLAIFRELDGLSRKEIARRLLTTVPNPLLDELKPLAKIELFAFAGKTEAAEREQLEQLVANPSASLVTGTTDLSQALVAGGSTSGEVMGVILFTEGRDLSGKALAPLATSLKASNIPVYPVMLGSTFRPKDLSIGSLEYPQAVYKSDHPQLKVTLTTVGFEGQTLDVELVPDIPDAQPLKKTVKVTGPAVTLEFDLDATEVGRKAFVVRTPVLEGETRDDNNSRSFAFTVVDDRAKVFVLDGDARWEFRYLEAAMSRDERVDLQRVLFQQPYLGILPEPFFPRTVVVPEDVSDTAKSPFANIDLVVLGDVSPLDLNDQLLQILREFVTDGGTLVISAGKRWMPLGYRSPILDQLLPLTNPRSIQLMDRSGEAAPSLRGLPVQLTVDGEQQSMLQFSADPVENQSIWKGLPGQMSAILGDPKPAATVWATTVMPQGQADPLAADRKHGLIIHQHLGSGQVLWIGFDGTWRWRQRVGDTYHHRFWGQLARWAAANKVTAGNEFVRFGPERPDLELGQDAVVRARWMAPFLQKYPKLKAHAEFFRSTDPPGKSFTTVELSPAVGNPLQHSGKAVSLPAGEYRVALTTENADLGPKPVEATLYVHDRPSQELSELSANRDLLTQIADSSGGRLFMADELRDLPRQFKTFDGNVSYYEETPLWDRWPWLVLLCALMTTEWILRKVNGLP
ncbi:MAG: VWA domain-containing protein [Planctomycetes bacterium]|nr:VWA domain-containing protein [Planctomycetota bacterium]